MITSTVRTATTHGVLAVLALVCGLGVAPAFGGRVGLGGIGPRALVLAVVAGAVVPAAVVAAAQVARVAAVVATAAALAISVAAVLAVAGCGPSVVRGPERILTAALPASADPASTGSIGLLVALASLVCSLVAAYSPERMRTLALVPVLLLLPVGFAVDAGARLPATSYAVSVVVVAAMALALLRAPADRPVAHRSGSLRLPLRTVWGVVGALAVLATAGVVVAASAAHLPGVRGRAADAQNLVEPPLRARGVVAPMTQYPAFADGDDPVDLHGTTSRRVGLLPMVTLSTFTGQTWSTASRYRRAGLVLSDATPADPLTVRVDATDADELSWLVRPDRPVSVDRQGLGTDRANGDLVVPAGQAYPSRYTVVGTAPVVATTAEANDAAPPLAGAVSTDPQPVPAMITRLADSAEPSPTAYDRLITLEQRLRNGAYRLATGPSVPTGCGYAQLVDLVSGKSHVGTSEQYASLFALSARILGYRSRVVLGFVPHYRARSDAFTITGRDVHAWAQVRFDGAGWVAFDTTPTRSSGTNVAPSPRPAPEQRGSRDPTSAAPTHPSKHSRAHAGASTPHSISPRWLLLLLFVPALLLLTPPVAKSTRRRRRRSRSTPGLAVLAAWQETTDRLLEAGSPVRRGRTTGEIAADAPEPARGDVRALGALLDRAGYAPEAAGRGEAAAAWAHASAARRALGAGMPRWRRILTIFDPRPLRRH